MKEAIVRHLTHGTKRTRTGARIGIEIETDFVNEDDRPPLPKVTQEILATTAGRPQFASYKIELGRQKIELAVAPQSGADALLARAHEALAWLYGAAARFGLRPRFSPEMFSDEPLIVVTNDRDALWLQIDGSLALEELCRCSAVQFTVDVNPADAIACINALWRAELHAVDYGANTARWHAYLDKSLKRHARGRFGGPAGVADIGEYAEHLAEHPVLMEGDVELFLRSVWWHYRLRRYGDALALEIRPISRRGDEQLGAQWERVRKAIGL